MSGNARFFPVLVIAALASYWLFPDYLVLLTQIFVLAIFALSYDLLQGFAGIVSLGHAAFFGIGAYTAALVAQAGYNEPVLGLLAAALLSALVAAVLTPVVARGNDLTRLLITLGVGSLLFEAANRARGLTGGADGLSDFTMGPVLGVFPFDFAGRTAFFYALAVLLLVYLLLLRIVTSPFGLALTGIRENPLRMASIGAPTARHIAVSYMMSGAMAGMAGAVLAQTAAFASLDMLGFDRSAEVVIVTSLGGTGSLFGVVLGAFSFGYLRDLLSNLSPRYWQLGLGLILMASVLFVRGGLAGGISRIRRRP
ncbi:MAG: branched-chain amino acid ABC transporter permease [Janthinobacterium lividum]